MGKALAGCRVEYERVQQGTNEPLVKTVIGDADYKKDLTSLSRAETFVNVMAEHSERITGKSLVATLSSSDDFYAGVGSTRLAILGKLIQGNAATGSTELAVASKSLADCQTALFNAGDDFVEFVMNFVGAEDDALIARNTTKNPNR